MSDSTMVKLQNLPRAKNKKVKLRLSANAKQKLVQLASREKIPTIADICKEMNCNNAKATEILKSIKVKRSQFRQVVRSQHKGCRSTGLEGFVYIVTNPCYPNWIKCGMTTNLESRLKSYNQADPLNRFKIECAKSVVDRRKTEKDMLEYFRINSLSSKGEWFLIKTNEYIAYFEQLV